jgi:hypothetical protein
MTVQLGDLISSALSVVGITDDRMSRWLGHPCGCSERREKLNLLGQWARRVLSGRTTDAREHFDSITGSKGDET